MQSERAGVAALVALKSGDQAKSRLSTVPAELRRRLAWAMAVDTLAALQAAIPQVLVVSDLPELETRLARAGVRARVLPEGRRGGMNAALRQGDHELRSGGVGSVLACVGDLPALTGPDVAEVLERAAGPGRFIVPDRSGDGTTMLIARDTSLDPLFQGKSAARHLASGAHSVLTDGVDDLARARCDVDTSSDLVEAARLGLGAATAAVVGRRPEPRAGEPD